MPASNASEHDAGDVPAGSSQAGSQPELDWILTSDEDNDRDRLGPRLGGPNRSATARYDHVHAAPYELVREGREPVDAAVGVSALDLQVAALDVAQVLQNHDHIATDVICPGGRRRAKIERPKPIHLPCLLRLSAERRGEEAAH